MAVFGYARDSQRHAADRQLDIIKCHLNIRELPATLYRDDESARTQRFASRPAGRDLWALLVQQPGHELIIASTAYAFGSLGEFDAALRDLDLKGVTTTLLDLGWRVTPGMAGRICGILVGARQLLRDWAGEKTKLTQAERKRSGKLAGAPPLGFKTVGRRGYRRIVPNERERVIMRRIVELHRQGLSFARIHVKFLEDRVTGRGSRRISLFSTKELSVWAIQHMHEAELMLEAKEQEQKTAEGTASTTDACGRYPRSQSKKWLARVPPR